VTTDRYHYTHITADGDEVAIERDEPMPFEEFQRLVGGYVEPVSTHHPDMLMLVNEDGRMLGLRHNEHARLLTGRLIVGDVLVMTRETFARTD
jgi:hypothetical protein